MSQQLTDSAPVLVACLAMIAGVFIGKALAGRLPGWVLGVSFALVLLSVLFGHMANAWVIGRFVAAGMSYFIGALTSTGLLSFVGGLALAGVLSNRSKPESQ